MYTQVTLCLEQQCDLKAGCVKKAIQSVLGFKFLAETALRQMIPLDVNCIFLFVFFGIMGTLEGNSEVATGTNIHTA